MQQNWIGKTIGGRYQINTLLGQGGMSAVYRATDPNLRRQVAIKLIHTHLSENPNFVDRFKEEAAAVARLRHPNIVQVHDFNHDGPTYYMVMEYLIGETLQARLKRLGEVNRFMPLDEAVTFCGQLCDAVGYAHKHGLIHRDIKPANIMLDLSGRAILMDFGIVKIVGGDYHTATGSTVGTAKYMPPEQIRSEQADERSDIYSLGVTLYEMLSGRTPYRADSAVALMMMVLNDPLPDLRDFRRGVPDALAAVVERAVTKAPRDRFQTMEEMAIALQGTQGKRPGISSVATVADKELQAKAPSTGGRPSQAEVSIPEGAQADMLQDTEEGAQTAPATPSLRDVSGADDHLIADSGSASIFARLKNSRRTSGMEGGKNRTLIIVIAVALLLCLCCAFLATAYFWWGDPLVEALGFG
jgi:serine/threonine protein kinase